jgi:prepilin-type N-terminal cleavage/methylation domain-containing protein
MSPHARNSAFTLLEMLVATAVFAVLMMVLLQMTSGLMTGVSRMDENLKMEQDVRLFFDILRRDLAQARIGTNQNQFQGTATNMAFVSSTQRMRTNYVSDQRLVTYFLADGSNNIYNIRRAVADPGIANYPTVWNPLVSSWWERAGFVTYISTNNEVVLSGVVVTNAEIFGYYLPGANTPVSNFPATTPPRGVKVNFNLAGQRALKTGQTDASQTRQIEYDVDLNIPPVFNP